MPATTTIAAFFTTLQDTAWDLLFFVLQYIFPILVTLAVIAIVWAVVMRIVHLGGRRKR